MNAAKSHNKKLSTAETMMINITGNIKQEGHFKLVAATRSWLRQATNGQCSLI